MKTKRTNRNLFFRTYKKNWENKQKIISDFKNLHVYNKNKINSKYLLFGVVRKVLDPKTVSVIIETFTKVKKYNKNTIKFRIFLVNTEGFTSLKVGDNVLFFITKKISKNKYSQLFRVLKN